METITFYSYKGGTGRSLALANTAVFLARCGKRVFVIDADLEAPGLNYKFKLSEGATKSGGLVEYLARKLRDETKEAQPYLSDYTCCVGHDLIPMGDGWIRLLPAGNVLSENYSVDLHAVNANLFPPVDSDDYSKAKMVFLRLHMEVENQFCPDYVLIDSRTGVTDIGGVMVRVLPDTVVCLVHKNPENYAGAIPILRELAEDRPVDSALPIKIILALTRVPELSLHEESILLRAVWEDFAGQAGDGHALFNVLVNPVVPLYSQPRLQLEEQILIGSDSTPNESPLLMGYYELFLSLGFVRLLEKSERTVLEELARAPRQESLRSRWMSTAPPVLFSKSGGDCLRTRTRTRPLRVVNAAYATGKAFDHFTSLIVESLRGVLNVELDPNPPAPIWPLLGEHLRDGYVDFCRDLFWLTDNRAQLSDIIQLGWCSEFTYFTANESKVKEFLDKVIDLRGGSGPSLTLSDICGELVHEFPYVSLGLLNNTPAATESHRIIGPLVSISQISTFEDENDLVYWLCNPTNEQTKQDKLIICDLVVVPKLHAALNSSSFDKKSTFFSGRRLLYRNRFPVGIVFPRGSHMWRREISNSVAEAILKLPEEISWDEITQDGESVSNDLQNAGIHPLSGLDLRLSLMMDKDFDSAVRWGHELTVLSRN